MPSELEDVFMSSVSGMLSRPEFLLPLAAAERQFRDHYYGLNSAALLEDLFFDALGTFLRQTRPRAEFLRPPTGQKGWDYKFEGLQISHKVSQGLGDIAALWDATKQGVGTWSFDEPIVYVLGGNAPPTLSLSFSEMSDKTVGVRRLADLGRPYDLDGRLVLIVEWPTSGAQPRLLDAVSSRPGENFASVIDFAQVWKHVAEHVASGGAANEIDVLVTNARKPPAWMLEAGQQQGGQPIDIASECRAGVYLLGRHLLQNLDVKTNNRAILIPKSTVKDCLISAASEGLFAPLPCWYWPYAEQRPPDMYSAQRAEYEQRFSARSPW